jgi:hypothetical protein
VFNPRAAYNIKIKLMAALIIVGAENPWKKVKDISANKLNSDKKNMNLHFIFITTKNEIRKKRYIIF